MSRPWQEEKARTDSSYMRRYKDVPKDGPPDATRLDIYRAPEPVTGPVVIFEHMRKTSGSSLRHVLHTNLAPAHDFELVVAREASEWFGDFWTAAERSDRIVAIAAHGASLAAPHCPRPVRLVTMVREPVDRALSRYYFAQPKNYPIDRVVSDKLDVKRAAFYLNGQSRTLLAPWVDDVDAIPRDAEDPDAARWLEELHRLLDRYLLGVQDRFLESMQLFAAELGWNKPYEATVKVNRRRPETGEIAKDVRDRLAALNWLDAELYRVASKRLGTPRT